MLLSPALFTLMRSQPKRTVAEHALTSLTNHVRNFSLSHAQETRRQSDVMSLFFGRPCSGACSWADDVKLAIDCYHSKSPFPSIAREKNSTSAPRSAMVHEACQQLFKPISGQTFSTQLIGQPRPLSGFGRPGTTVLLSVSRTTHAHTHTRKR